MRPSQSLEIKDRHYSKLWVTTATHLGYFFRPSVLPTRMDFTGFSTFCLLFCQGQTHLKDLEAMKFRVSTLIKVAKFQEKVWTINTFRMEIDQLTNRVWLCIIIGDWNHYLSRSPPFLFLLSNLTLHRNMLVLPAESLASLEVVGWTPVPFNQGSTTTNLVPIILISSFYVFTSLLQHTWGHCTFAGTFRSLKAWTSVHFWVYRSIKEAHFSYTEMSHCIVFGKALCLCTQLPRFSLFFHCRELPWRFCPITTIPQLILRYERKSTKNYLFWAHHLTVQNRMQSRSKMLWLA